jgi:phosphoglucosamine mutase
VGQLFGTDGVRGKANEALTAELALSLSVAAAHVLGETGEFHGHPPLAVVGRDPRASGEFLEAAVVAGLASAGVNVVRLGVLPTPGVAYLTEACDADLGVMLSASHNPMPDNGIKFFARGGNKLDDALEDAIESRLTEMWPRPTGADVGRVTVQHSLVETYVAHLVSSLGKPVSLEGIKVVVDCANGAAFQAAPAAFEAQGADVHRIHAEPDGININENCGSTHMDSLVAAVLEQRADIGIALDGDADRCLAVDTFGRIVDGDQILAMLALALREEGRLKNDTVVATVMSNLGLVNAMRSAGVTVQQTKVGDRYVLEAMKAGGFVLGGEQSGHVVMLEHATTGDGILTVSRWPSWLR